MESATQNELPSFDSKFMDISRTTFEIDEFDWAFEGISFDAPGTGINDTTFDSWLEGGLVSSEASVPHDEHIRLAHIEQMIEKLEKNMHEVSGQMEEIARQFHRIVDMIECLRTGMAQFTKTLAGLLQPFFQWTKSNESGNVDRQA